MYRRKQHSVKYSRGFGRKWSSVEYSTFKGSREFPWCLEALKVFGALTKWGLLLFIY